MALSALVQLDKDIELAEREFLEETLIDDEENDDGITDDDDHEFDTQLELAGEITLRTGIPLATKKLLIS